MARDSEFVAFVVDQLAGLGAVRARAMFGGHGIYLDDLMFALVVDDRLYLKADEQTRPVFEARGLVPFTYQRQGREQALGFHLAPEEGFDDPAELCRWAAEALAVARRAAARKTTKKGRPRTARKE